MDNETRTCSNCKHFQRFYVVAYNYTFKPLPLGRCINTSIKKDLSAKHIRKDEGCDLWQLYELQKLNVKYGIERRLRNLCQSIEDTLAVLRDAE